MPNLVRRKLISRRREDSESSEDELIIELSDTESSSSESLISTSSDDEQQPSGRDEGYIKANSTYKVSGSWADAVDDDVISITSRSKPRDLKRESVPRHQKKSENILSEKWTHDLYDSDDDGKPRSNNIKKTPRNRKKIQNPTSGKDSRKRLNLKLLDLDKKSITPKKTIRMDVSSAKADLSMKLELISNEDITPVKAKSAHHTEIFKPLPMKSPQGSPETLFENLKGASTDLMEVITVVEVRSSPNTEIRDVSESMENISLEKPAEVPRVRRGISQAAKNQLIASFTKNPPVKPPFIPVVRTNSASPSRATPPLQSDTKPQPSRLTSAGSDIPLAKDSSQKSDRDIRRERSEKRGGSEQSDWADTKDTTKEVKDIRRDRIEQKHFSDKSTWGGTDRNMRREKSEKQAIDNHKLPRERSYDKRDGSDKSNWAHNDEKDKLYEKRKSRPFSSSSSLDMIPTNSSSRRSSAVSTNFETKDIKHENYPEQQLFNNGSGWALINPKKIEKDSERQQPSKSQKNDAKKESRSYKKKHRSPSPTDKKLEAATQQPQQPMINVQPMITQSGHVVLMTESGLCVPATPEMFQYQQWYDSTMRQSQSQGPQSPYYYSQQQYYEKSKD